jgi:hypothetical protein
MLLAADQAATPELYRRLKLRLDYQTLYYNHFLHPLHLVPLFHHATLVHGHSVLKLISPVYQVGEEIPIELSLYLDLSLETLVLLVSSPLRRLRAVPIHRRLRVEEEELLARALLSSKVLSVNEPLKSLRIADTKLVSRTRPLIWV